MIGGRRQSADVEAGLKPAPTEASTVVVPFPARRPRLLPPLLALGARVRVGWRPGRIVGRSRDCPIRYDVRYDDGASEIGVDGGRVLPPEVVA